MKTKGYVSDVITDAAIQFIEKKGDRPFFVYLPFNCPHSPHQVPDEYRQRYQGKDFGAAKFPKQGASDGREARPGRSRPGLRHDREHRRQRGPPAGEARRAQAGRQHDRGLLLRQRLPEAQRLQRGLSGLEGHAVGGRHPPVLFRPLARAAPGRPPGGPHCRAHRSGPHAARSLRRAEARSG